MEQTNGAGTMKTPRDKMNSLIEHKKLYYSATEAEQQLASRGLYDPAGGRAEVEDDYHPYYIEMCKLLRKPREYSAVGLASLKAASTYRQGLQRQFKRRFPEYNGRGNIAMTVAEMERLLNS